MAVSKSLVCPARGREGTAPCLAVSRSRFTARGGREQDPNPQNRQGGHQIASELEDPRGEEETSNLGQLPWLKHGMFLKFRTQESPWRSQDRLSRTREERRRGTVVARSPYSEEGGGEKSEHDAYADRAPVYIRSTFTGAPIGGPPRGCRNLRITRARSSSGADGGWGCGCGWRALVPTSLASEFGGQLLCIH